MWGGGGNSSKPANQIHSNSFNFVQISAILFEFFRIHFNFRACLNCLATFVIYFAFYEQFSPFISVFQLFWPGGLVTSWMKWKVIRDGGGGNSTKKQLNINKNKKQLKVNINKRKKELKVKKKKMNTRVLLQQRLGSWRLNWKMN